MNKAVTQINILTKVAKEANKGKKEPELIPVGLENVDSTLTIPVTKDPNSDVP